MNRSISAFVFMVPVGLFGLAIKMILVFGVIRPAMASRSCRISLQGTMMFVPPPAWVIILYTTKDGSAEMISSPG